MSTENKIVGSITVSAPFEREDRTYYATVIFDLHEDGQRSLRAQRIDDGRYVVHDQDFQEEAYALMHAWDTRELELTVAELKRENAALRLSLQEMLEEFAGIVPNANCACHIAPPCSDCVTWAGARERIADARAALSPQEAARG